MASDIVDISVMQTMFETLLIIACLSSRKSSGKARRKVRWESSWFVIHTWFMFKSVILNRELRRVNGSNMQNFIVQVKPWSTERLSCDGQ
ncbi:hypothetical protein L1987_60258 [Smallanthus sonchifolius]|uniref:Uncharacterized protein n=1 Tax=Smallanthus sonchifolius TaxID=185202 RepID=A0ACB9D8D9_9ASTR|nr:hypothetical protein L1987_60258 [Smallanthus sonchifolius]